MTDTQILADMKNKIDKIYDVLFTADNNITEKIHKNATDIKVLRATLAIPGVVLGTVGTVIGIVSALLIIFK